MKYLIPLLFLATLAACDEPIPEPEPELIEYQVRFEVECDSCMAAAAVMAVGPYDSVLGYWTFDTIAFLGQGINLTALDFGTTLDSIVIRVSVNDNIVIEADTVGTDGIVFGESYVIQ